MKLLIEEREDVTETEIIVRCRRADPQIMGMLASLRAFDRKITGLREGKTFLLEAKDILYIDTADKKTFLYTAGEIYETPLRLYELEERLAACDFFRASKSSIVNFNQIKSMRPDFGGRLLLAMSNGEELYVSRQYVGAVKEKLGLK